MQGQKETPTVCFPTRDSANTNLLISSILSHDACIVLVSEQTPFTLRERVSQARDGFQITTWYCRILRLTCSPSNSQSRSKHREKQTTGEHTGRKGQTGDDGQKSARTALFKTHRQQWGKQNHPAVPVPHSSQKTCLFSAQNCVPQNGYNGKPTEGRVWSPRKTCTSKRVRDNTRT